MLDSYAVVIEGLDEVNFADDPAKIEKLASQAINKTLTRARTMASKQMRGEINFPARYLVGANGRLRISRQANPARLEGVIQGRDRATSLARFISGNPRAGSRAGVRVKVGAGQTKRMPAFVMKLKNDNIGLALRLKPGESVKNKKVMIRAYSQKNAGRRKPSDARLYLLYGPSVDQVFQSVREDIAPKAADYMEGEFARLMETFL